MAFDFSDMGAAAPNREQLLNLAITTAKGGNRDAARVMFMQVLAEDKRNERAMLWMASIARSRQERIEWLQRVLEVNPNNQYARDTLRKMKYVKSARENRVLVVFGVIVGVLIIVSAVILIAAISAR
jgi:Tfp pilus assembly protein PilF